MSLGLSDGLVDDISEGLADVSMEGFVDGLKKGLLECPSEPWAEGENDNATEGASEFKGNFGISEGNPEVTEDCCVDGDEENPGNGFATCRSSDGCIDGIGVGPKVRLGMPSQSVVAVFP